MKELRGAIEKEGVTAVIRNSGVSAGAVDGVMKGSRPRLDTFLSLAYAVRMDLGFLSGTERPASDGLVPVHLVGPPASAGGGLVPIDDELGELLGLSERFLRRYGLTPNAVAACDVVGDSMEKPDGSGIRNGAIALVDTSVTPGDVKTGRTYVIVREQDVLIKRLEHRLDGQLIMHSDNPKYAPEAIPPNLADQFHIVGEVRCAIDGV